MLDEISTSTNGNHVLGNECFKREIADMLYHRVTMGMAGRPVIDGVN